MEQSVENHSTIVNRAEIIFQTGEFQFPRFKDASLFRHVAFKREKETRLLLFMLLGFILKGAEARSNLDYTARYELK